MVGQGVADALDLGLGALDGGRGARERRGRRPFVEIEGQGASVQPNRSDTEAGGVGGAPSRLHKGASEDEVGDLHGGGGAGCARQLRSESGDDGVEEAVRGDLRRAEDEAAQPMDHETIVDAANAEGKHRYAPLVRGIVEVQQEVSAWKGGAAVVAYRLDRQRRLLDPRRAKVDAGQTLMDKPFECAEIGDDAQPRGARGPIAQRGDVDLSPWCSGDTVEDLTFEIEEPDPHVEAPTS